MAALPGPDGIRRFALVVWASIGTILLAAFALWIANQIRIIWLPLAFGGGLVLLLNPIVRGLQRVAIPRVVGTFVAFVLMVGVLVAVGFLVVPPIRQQAADFAAQLPTIYDELVLFLQQTGDQLGFELGPVWTSERLQEWISDPAHQEQIQQLLGGFGSGAGRILRGVAESVVVLLLAPVIAIYILIDLPRMKALAVELTPPRLREEAIYVGRQVARALGAFVRGQLLVAFIVGVLSSALLYVLEVPFWLIIGMVAGFLNLVPFVGPVAGGALAALVSLVSGHLTDALLAVAGFTLIQQFDNHVVTPLVQRARVRLSPLTIVLALVVGGSVAGFLGVLVAVPVVTVFRIVVGHLWRTRVLGESWEQASEAMIEETPPPERMARMRRRPNQPKLFDTAELPPVVAPEGDEPQPGEVADAPRPSR